MIIHNESTASILLGDCVQGMKHLSDQSMQMCVTSPPYFGLRDYGHAGQIGLEATPAEFVAKMVEVFREVRRVLRDDGTLWLNLGDSYASNGTNRNGLGNSAIGSGPDGACKQRNIAGAVTSKVPEGLKPKDLIGIPWRVAFALQDDGWYLRQEIIWHKPNPMPESVTDRCTKAHESLFLLAKSERYLCDMDAIKEPAKEWHGQAANFDRGSNAVALHVLPGQSAAQHRPRPSVKRGDFNGKTNTMPGREAFRAVVPTRNRRSVWTVATRPYKGAHFATFPPALIEPCILAGSRPGDFVLDPFGGSGTTAGVALKHGRHALLCELNSEYAALIPERVASICKDSK
jgi:DNA modification methylase